MPIISESLSLLNDADLAALLERARAFHRSGDLEQAEAGYRAVLVQSPADPSVLRDLAWVLFQRGQPAAGAEQMTAAVAASPDSAPLLRDLATMLSAAGRPEEAVRHNLAALQLDPQDPLALFNLGNAYRMLGRVEDAIGRYAEALRYAPDDAEIHLNLGVTLRATNDLAGAIDAFRSAIRCQPSYAAAHYNLGSAYEAEGKPAEAIACFEEAFRLTGNDGLKINCALTFPVIMGSRAQIDERRRQLDQDLAALSARSMLVHDPIQSIGSPGFSLAYHGYNEREFQSRIAALLHGAVPSLEFTAPHCAARTRRPAGQRVKIGFVSAHFRNHTIGKLNAGLIARLDRRRFEVEVFRIAGTNDETARFIADSADAAIDLPPSLAAAQSEIADRRLDLLFYTDVGFDAFSYYLAHARLAPVQCVTWGHPLTTGIPTIDYFISSEDLEPADAQAHYTERLVRLPHLANHYFRPKPSTSTKTREDFGLPVGVDLYACLQSLFKLHPDDDDVFASILRRDPRGRLVLLEGNYPHWTHLIRERFGQAAPDVADRLMFVSQQPPDDFSRLLATVDVLLDPQHFGGGDTSYQSFAVGAPVVTLPGGFLRSRITYALYRTMGVDDCVAADTGDYVERAVRLGTDPEWNRQVRQRILAANHLIYENDAGVRELEQFLVDAVARV